VELYHQYIIHHDTALPLSTELTFIMNLVCMVPNTVYTLHSFFTNHEVVGFSTFLWSIFNKLNDHHINLLNELEPSLILQVTT